MAMDCKSCEELLLDYVYGELDEPTARSVAAHLETCAACRRREGRYRATLARLDVLKGVEIPTESARTIRQALSREMLLAGPGSEVKSYGLFSRRHTLAAAAVLLVAAAIYVVMNLGGPGSITITRAAYAESEVRHVAYELTVFNSDLALVKDKRIIVNLQRGENLVRFTDVAAMIDPTSVRFTSDTDPLTTKVLEQNYEFDLATPAALLRRFIDQKVTCVTKDGQLIEGYLASYDLSGGASLAQVGQVTLPRPGPLRGPARSDRFVVNQSASYQTGNDFDPLSFPQQYWRDVPAARSLVLSAKPGKGETAIVSIDDLESIRLATIPKGLLVKPTLVWTVKTERPGPHNTVLAYQTRGFSWNADYVVTVGKGDVLDWQGWVTISNTSGTRYPDTKLKLIAGDVHRVTEEKPVDHFLMTRTEANAFGVADKAFEEKAFFEYHLYTLSEPTTLNNNQTKQLKLLRAADVKAQRRYVFEASRNPRNALVELEVWNKKENRLGMPLPKGRVRFRQLDPDDELQYIGQDAIDHTPKDEKITLKIGTVFDIVGERKGVRASATPRSRTETVTIPVRNHKSEPVVVIVREHPNPGDWNVSENNIKYEKVNVTTIEFPLEIPANSERSVTYTIRYQW